MKTKHYAVAISIIALGAVLTTYFIRDESPTSTSQPPGIAAITKDTTRQAQPFVVEAETAPNKIADDIKADKDTSQDNSDNALPPSILETMALGHVLSEDLAPYKSYDDDALLALMQQDDRLAAMAYLGKATDIDDRCARSELVIRTGATGDAIGSLFTCAINMVHDVHRKDKALSRELLIDTLAIIKFAILRGDYQYTGYGDLHLKDFGVELKEADFATIHDLAMERLNNINHYRRDQGLEPFEVVTKSYMRDLDLKTVNREDLSEWRKELLSIR